MDENKLEEAMADTVEQSFNDSELEDIMNEIENLEKEFVEDGEKSPEDLVITESKQNQLQDEIDKEVQSISSEMTPTATTEGEVISDPVETQEVTMAEETTAEASEEIIEETLDEVLDETINEAEEISDETIDEVADELVAEMETEEIENNVVELATAKETQSTEQGANMDFTASGTMDFNLNFKIGDEVASLKVDGDEGLTVEMGGVNIKITESGGCSVTLEGGVSFNIPLTGAGEAAKKKAA